MRFFLERERKREKPGETEFFYLSIHLIHPPICRSVIFGNRKSFFSKHVSVSSLSLSSSHSPNLSNSHSPNLPRISYISIQKIWWMWRDMSIIRILNVLLSVRSVLTSLGLGVSNYTHTIYFKNQYTLYSHTYKQRVYFH